MVKASFQQSMKEAIILTIIFVSSPTSLSLFGVNLNFWKGDGRGRYGSLVTSSNRSGVCSDIKARKDGSGMVKTPPTRVDGFAIFGMEVIVSVGFLLWNPFKWISFGLNHDSKGALAMIPGLG